MMTAGNIGSIRTTSLRDRSFFVFFTGRFACGRPESE
jgi:hypothetical protein